MNVLCDESTNGDIEYNTLNCIYDCIATIIHDVRVQLSNKYYCLINAVASQRNRNRSGQLVFIDQQKHFCCSL